MQSSPVIWTIGHSNHTFEHFAKLLQAEGIEVVVDVRSYPYSRIAPHFNREELDAALRRAGTRYLFFGRKLGGRPSCEADYDEDGHARYDRMAEQPGFQRRFNVCLSGAASIGSRCFAARASRTSATAGCSSARSWLTTEWNSVISSRWVVHQEDLVALGSRDGQESLFGEETGVEIYTIGFTQTTAEHFFGRLKAAGVKRLLDVRLNNCKGDWGSYERCFLDLMAERQTCRLPEDRFPLTRDLLAGEGGPFAIGTLVELGEVTPQPEAPETEDLETASG